MVVPVAMIPHVIVLYIERMLVSMAMDTSKENKKERGVMSVSAQPLVLNQ